MKSVNPLNYYTENQWKCIKNEMDSHPTPNLVIDLALIEKSYLELQENFQFAKIYYAVKANPNTQAMQLLASLGANFDVASRYELDRVLNNGGSPERMSYGNTIKKTADIKYAYDKGCRVFATDSEEDLRNIAEFAPGSGVFFRILVDGSKSADWPLSHKFGAHVEVVEDLIPLARELGLYPRGVSFHVGSQQNDVEVWGNALEVVAGIFHKMKLVYGIELDLINMGGGLPAKYLKDNKSIQEYSNSITGYLKKYFPEGFPRNIIMEPGRSLFGNCGAMSTSVILISKKSRNTDDKWLYIDNNLYNGLTEAIDESIKYPMYSDAEGELCQDFIIAGNSHDSSDLIYQKFREPLPDKIDIGDKIYWLSSGAYTTICCTGVNGYPTLPTYIINSNKYSGNNLP